MRGEKRGWGRSQRRRQGLRGSYIPQSIEASAGDCDLRLEAEGMGGGKQEGTPSMGESCFWSLGGGRPGAVGTQGCEGMDT